VSSGLAAEEQLLARQLRGDTGVLL